MKSLIALLVFSFGMTCVLRAEPLQCSKAEVLKLAQAGDRPAMCKMTYFDRVDDLIYPAVMHKPEVNQDPKHNLNYVGIIRGAGTKVLYSGTILEVTYRREDGGMDVKNAPEPDVENLPKVGICSHLDWRVVAMARESSNILIYGPADISEFCNFDNRITVVLPVTVIWAELYSSKANLRDPFRKAPGKITAASDTDAYCGDYFEFPAYVKDEFDQLTEIRPCDRYSWIKFMYNPPAGPIWNSWTQPGASQGTISFTPAIGKVPNTIGGPPGEKAPSEALTFDVQEYPSQMWGYGYIGFPIVFEKASAPTANLNSLVFGISYDIPLAAHHTKLNPHSGIDSTGGPWRLFPRPPDFRLQYGPELAVSTPHDLNVTGALSARFPIVLNMPRQPSVITIFPSIGIEAGNHVVTHIINGQQPESNPIFRQVYGWDSSLRVPFIVTHAFLGDKPTTIDFAWRTRRLSYAEPFTDYVSGVAETLAKHPQSYWRGSWIVPFSQLAQFKVTVQHGGLPPDFDYLGYSVNLGLTLGNPGYSEH
jgi:hypothetical protein